MKKVIHKYKKIGRRTERVSINGLWINKVVPIYKCVMHEKLMDQEIDTK